LAAAMRQGVFRRVPRRPRAHDPAMAWHSALAAMLAISLICAGWIATGWPAGDTAAMMASVMCVLYAALDNPAVAILGFLKKISLGAVLAGVWLFAVLPSIDGFIPLAASLAVVLLPSGMMIPTMPGVLAFVFGFGGLMALQETYNATFDVWTNAVLAQAVGIGATALILRLVRSVGGEFTARRLLAASRRELAAIAAGSWKPDAGEFAHLLLDRIGDLAPRLAASASGAGPGEREALATLRAGLNLIALHAVRPTLPRHAAARVDVLLATLARQLRGTGQPRLPERLARARQTLAQAGQLEAALSVDGLARALNHVEHGA